MSILNHLLKLLPVRKNKVVFYTYANQFADHPKYIAKALLERVSKLKPVWVTESKKVKTMPGLRSACGRYISRFHLATAHIIVSNARLGKYWSQVNAKKPGQVYIQTWHSALSIKKIEADLHRPKEVDTIRSRTDSQNIDYLLSCSRWQTELYRACFHYTPAEICEFGAARNDILLSPPSELVASIRHRLGIESDNEKIALYTPTFRERANTRFTPPDFERIVKALQKRFGGDWKVYACLPPGQQGKRIEWILNEKNVYSTKSCEDISEFMCAADAMISDYSPCIFDFLLTKKPAFLYTPDADQYDRERGLYFPLNESPFPPGKDNDELISRIENFDADSYASKAEAFLKQMGYRLQPNASERAAELIETCAQRPVGSLLQIWGSLIGRAIRSVKANFLRTKLMRPKPFHLTRLFGIPIWRKKCPAKPAAVLKTSPYHNLPVQPNKIVFHSALRGYSCNPKYIAEEILRQKLPYELVWVMGPYPKDFNLLRFMDSFPPNMRVVLGGTDDDEKEMATAKIWIENYNRIGNHISDEKKPGQYYINTHHGSFGIKKDGPEQNNPPKDFLIKRRRDAEKLDYLISNSRWVTEYYRRVFWNNGEIVQVGSPRNDILFTKDRTPIIRKVYDKLGIPPHKKMLIYAPSWRPRARKTKNFYFLTIDYTALAKELQKKWGGEWVIAARLHQADFANSRNALRKYADSLVDASEYDDIQELFVAADVIISDYSSCMFDYLLTRRPGFLYVPDYEEYENIWGLYYPLEEVPFPLARNNKELLAHVANYDMEQYSKQVEAFLESKGSVDDGHAAAKVVELIKKIAPLDNTSEEQSVL